MKFINILETTASVTLGPADTAAWIACAASLCTVSITALVSFLIYSKGRKDTVRDRILSERKKVLFDALQVIDLIYANSEFNNLPPPLARRWDIRLARETMNGMLIYCANPERVVKAFRRSAGMDGEEYSPASLNEFRVEVARELELQKMSYVDNHNAWIVALPGTPEGDQAKSMRSSDSSLFS